jgi:hypothetical protein
MEKQKEQQTQFNYYNSLSNDQLATMLANGELADDGVYLMLDANRRAQIDYLKNQKLEFKNANLVGQGKDAVTKAVDEALASLKLQFDEAKKLVPEAPELEANYYDLVRQFNQENDGLISNIGSTYTNIMNLQEDLATLKDRIRKEYP